MSTLKKDSEKILLQDQENVKLIGREEEEKYLNEKIFIPISEGKHGTFTYIYGSTGLGKSALVKKMARDSGIPSIYISGKQHTSTYQILIEIARQIGCAAPSFGWYEGIIWNKIKANLEYTRKHFIAILDEMDEVLKKNRANCENFLQSFIEFPSILNHGGFTAIVITNNPLTDRQFILSPSINDRLNASGKLVFKNYIFPDLIKIMRYYASITLKEETWDDDSLLPIVKHIYNTSGSVREAKFILYKIAEHSSDKLDINLLEDSIKLSRSTMQEEEIRNLPKQLILTLLAIIEAYEERNTSKQNIYKKYCKFCDLYNTEPATPRSVHNYIHALQQKHLISLSKEKGKTIVIPKIDIYEGKKILEQLLKP